MRALRAGVDVDLEVFDLGRSADLFCLERLWPDQHDRRLFVGLHRSELGATE